MTTMLIADDHDDVRLGLQVLLSNGQAGKPWLKRRTARKSSLRRWARPDVAIDHSLSFLNGVEVTDRSASSRLPPAPD
jgi:hypothetical protein